MKLLLASLLLVVPVGAGCSNQETPAAANSNGVGLAAATMHSMPWHGFASR